MTVLINAANLRHGGGVQVAASFLDEAAAIAVSADNPYPWLSNATVWASPEVLANVDSDTRSALRIEERSATVDVRGRRLGRFDASFTVFGPEYVAYRSGYSVVGFADVTSLFPEHLAPASGLRRAKQVLRLTASRSAFRRADKLLVEAEHIARALVSRWRINPSAISVIPNTYNALFHHPEAWQDAPPRERISGIADLLYVTRAYAHKNLAILGEVAEAAGEMGVRVRFVLTLREQEWAALPTLTRRHAVNVGPVTVPQLPNLYRSCDAAFFPSLFEAFSVIPLEALVTGTPLVTSDRDFVRDVVQEHARYADPLSARDLADAVVAALDEGRGARTAAAQAFALAWPNAESRAVAYLDTLDRALKVT